MIIFIAMSCGLLKFQRSTDDEFLWTPYGSDVRIYISSIGNVKNEIDVKEIVNTVVLFYILIFISLLIKMHGSKRITQKTCVTSRSLFTAKMVHLEIFLLLHQYNTYVYFNQSLENMDVRIMSVITFNTAICFI